MNKSESIKNLAAALCKAQNQMGGAAKDSRNPFFKSKYADLASVIKAIKEAFYDNGLSYSQFPIYKDGCVGVETILMHESGEWMSNELYLPMPKQDPQSGGSAITYARRYALQSIAGIPSEDDDANHATFNKQTKEKPTYDKFHEHVDRFKELLSSGKETKGSLIAMLLSKYAVPHSVLQQIESL